MLGTQKKPGFVNPGFSVKINYGGVLLYRAVAHVVSSTLRS
jgi:hypothetical protein